MRSTYKLTITTPVVTRAAEKKPCAVSSPTAATVQRLAAVVSPRTETP